MRGSWLMLMLMCSPAFAGEQTIPEGLLEYLGSMVEQDGEWVDPLALRAADPSAENTGPAAEDGRAGVDTEAGSVAAQSEDENE